MIENETEKLISQIRNKITRSEIYQEYISLKTALLNSGYLEEDVKKIITSDYISLPTEKEENTLKLRWNHLIMILFCITTLYQKKKTKTCLKKLANF